MRIKFAQFDFEVTNRCNAECHFCPRDLTPHQGLMDPSVFDQALARAVEFREVAVEKLEAKASVALCGLGEPLLNPHLPEFVARVRAAEFDCSVSSNGALLTEKKGTALLDAGLSRIDLNVGERGDAYEDVYKLKWEKTYQNIVRFLEMAEGRCAVWMVLVNHRRDHDHLREMVEFWRGHGVKHFQPYEIINRGGSLSVGDVPFEAADPSGALAAIRSRTSDIPVCVAPFVSHFVGYDGQHYLCCQDWTKKTAMGSVFDRSFMDVMEAKLDMVTTRDLVCRSCNVDPVNKVIEANRSHAAGHISDEVYEKTVDRVGASVEAATDVIQRLGLKPPASLTLSKPATSPRRLPIA